jgi:hypothetical protein
MTIPLDDGAPATRLSKLSLISLICGILACVPGLGLLAVILGIIGLILGARPGVWGRWMAAVGVLLGLMGCVVWILVLAGWIRAFSWFTSTTSRETTTVNSFITALEADNHSVMKAESSGISDADLETFSTNVRAQGGLVGADLHGDIDKMGGGHVSGTVEFKSGKQHLNASLQDKSSGWQITEWELKP